MQFIKSLQEYGTELPSQKFQESGARIL